MAKRVEVHMTAQTRQEFGKGAARRTRREGNVPAVLYGHGEDPWHLALPAHDLWLALKNGGSNALLYLDIEGEERIALTKQVQVDPIKRDIEHVDFIIVRRGEKVVVDVPIHLEGEAVRDTLVITEANEVSVEADALNIPEWILVSIEGAEIGTQVHASDLDLPSGSELLTDPEELIVNITEAPTEEDLEAELDTEGAGVEEDESDDAEGGDAAEGGDSGDDSGDE